MNYKSILISGSCSIVGRELLHQLIYDFNAGEVICLDENKRSIARQEKQYRQFENARFYYFKFRDKQELAEIMEGVDIVFHAAAPKDSSLFDGYQNFAAQQAVINSARNSIRVLCEDNVQRIIFNNLDKAFASTDLKEASKRPGRDLICDWSMPTNRGQIVASVRFGSILGTEEAISSTFCDQIRKGGPVTIADPKKTCFFMSSRQAARLLIDASVIAMGGEVFIAKMPVIRIKDLAEIMIEAFAPVYGHKPENIDICITGGKSGEKFYEELINKEEACRTIELASHFVIKSLNQENMPTYPEMICQSMQAPYKSADETPMSKNALRSFLHSQILPVVPKAYFTNPCDWWDREPRAAYP